MLDGLERRGFRLDFGEGGTGWSFKYLTRGGGYYFNVGCSDLIVSGEIKLAQFSDIEGFVAEGARMKSGETIAADLVVLATGYKKQEELVKKLFGEEVAQRIGPIWGFGEDQEMRNMFTRTAQPGLWFIAGRPRAMPHRLEISGAADQGDRGGVAAESISLVIPAREREPESISPQ